MIAGQSAEISGEDDLSARAHFVQGDQAWSSSETLAQTGPGL